MTRTVGSLRRTLLIWIMVPLTVVVALNTWLSFLEARSTADLVTDRTLLASARVIAEQVKAVDGVVEALIPPSALEMFVSRDHDRVLYRITDTEGRLIAGYPDVVAPPHPPDGLQPLYFDAVFRHSPIRVVAIAQPVVFADHTASALVVVGETKRGRDHLLTDLWLNSLRDQVLLIFVAAVFTSLGLTRGLAPLLRLRDRVLAQDPRKPRPLPLDTLHSELRPLAQALNEALSRVQAHTGRQKRFIANAAHQLRTPLAILKTQAGVGLRGDTMAAKDEALAAIDTSAEAMRHLVNQLLSLEHADSEGTGTERTGQRREPLDFHGVVRECLERLTPLALARGIDLGFEAPDEPVPLVGHPTMLREMVTNLVDNAIRHGTPGTPDTLGTIVTASLEREGDTVVLRVEDNGPGIPEAEREAVFERFYRVLGGEADGAGLGLSIVREIVHAHGGTITLAERSPPPGLAVRVTLPTNA